MHRIDTSTAQVDKFGSGKNGFTGGNPQTGQLPTALDADYFDTLQEELAAVIESAGIILNKAANNQLLMAIRAMTPGRLLGSGPKMITASSTYSPTPGTKFAIVELVGASGGTGGCTATGSGQSVCTSPSCQGAYAMIIVPNPVSTLVTIGSAGTGQGGSAQATSGGASSFGSLLICPGGGGSYPAAPNSGAITPSIGPVAAVPTINSGATKISTVETIRPLNAIQVSFGLSTGWRASGNGPMPGANYGRSVDGIYIDQNQAANVGNTGNPGACRIWEYA